MEQAFHRNDKKLINRWAMYDWANSVYSLCIATAVFPIYYTSVTNTVNNGIVRFIGREYDNDALYAYALSFSFIIVALISPLLAPIADYKRSKLSFMKAFCYAGSISCGALYFFTGDNIQWGILFFVLASIGFAGSLVYYNAYLKEIVDESLQDRTSARGFSLGYIGSVILLIVNLVMVLQPGLFGISDTGEAARISFITVGIWWAGFAQIPFRALKRFRYRVDVSENKEKVSLGFLLGGYRELRSVFNQLKHYRALRNFLIAFFFYNSAVQTVMYMASIFGAEVVFAGDPNGESKLIACILLIQLVAIGGAWMFSTLSMKRGNITSLSVALLIWIGICGTAYFLQTQVQFYVVAFFVGMVMGGVQAISRSTYSKLIPETRDTASFFSFYDATEKLATVFGTAIYGLVSEITGNMRNTTLVLLLFFIVGISLLRSIRSEPVLKPLYPAD